MPSDHDGQRLPADAERLRAAFEAIERLPRRKDQVLPALLAAQHALGWLPREAITRVHEHVRVPISELYATATGYSELRLKPPVPGRWHVCTGVACDLAGAGELLMAAPEETAPVDCQFLCALAPVAVDEREGLHGRVTAESLREQISATRSGGTA